MTASGPHPSSATITGNNPFDFVIILVLLPSRSTSRNYLTECSPF